MLDIFENSKKQIGERYIQSLGESIDRVAPLRSKEMNEKSKFFWDTANDWNPNIEKEMRVHLEKMKKIFE